MVSQTGKPRIELVSGFLSVSDGKAAGPGPCRKMETERKWLARMQATQARAAGRGDQGRAAAGHEGRGAGGEEPGREEARRPHGFVMCSCVCVWPPRLGDELNALYTLSAFSSSQNLFTCVVI